MSTVASIPIPVKPAPADPPGKRPASERTAARRRVSRAMKLHSLQIRWAQFAAEFWKLWEDTPDGIFTDSRDWGDEISDAHDLMEDVQIRVALAYAAAAVGRRPAT